MCRPALGPTRPPIQWEPRALSLGVRRPGHEADLSPPFSAEANNALSYTSITRIRLNGMVVGKKSTGKILPLLYFTLFYYK
jgi:hypothetical protein